jgi:hypothetical protein
MAKKKADIEEHRAPLVEPQLLALAKAEEAGILPDEDRRHEDVAVEAAPPGPVIVVEEPAVIPIDVKVEIPNDQIHVIRERDDGTRVDAAGNILIIP